MLENAIHSGSLWLLSLTALFLGFFHTILGPDHYLPFVMMSRAERWSRAKTFRITLLAGLGHVASSLTIGVILAALGATAASWETTSWARLHESRGSLTAWLLMGVGAAYLLWSLLKLFRQKRHVHFHLHDGDTAHAHVHDHGRLIHMHVHPKARLTPWVLFAIFVFGPCESLIPLMLSGFALGGAPAMFWVALLFSGATVMTIILSVAALLAGIRKVSLRFLERYAGAAAGFSLILCGAAIRFLGL